MCPPDPGCPLRFGWRDAGEAKGTGEGPRHPPPPRNVPRFAFELPAGGLRPRRVSPPPPPPGFAVPHLKGCLQLSWFSLGHAGKNGLQAPLPGFLPIYGYFGSSAFGLPPPPASPQEHEPAEGYLRGSRSAPQMSWSWRSGGDRRTDGRTVLARSVPDRGQAGT